MLKIYNFIIKLLQGTLNLLFIIQIVLMILVFLTASYWFFDLLNSDLFSFAQPLVTSIENFVKMFHQQDIEVGGVYVDGTLLLFDFIAVIAVILLAKSKYYLFRLMDEVNDLIRGCKQKIENQFNAQLQSEVEESIKKSNNTAILVEFKVKSMVSYSIDKDLQGQVADKQDEAFKVFYNVMKSVSGCKFAKSGDKLLIFCSDFNNIDNVLSFINNVVNRLRQNFKTKKWNLTSYISMQVYDDKTDFKQDVYPVLDKLLTIRHKNEAVCLGNFCLRYKLNKEQLFTPFLKGSYDIFGDTEVWSLVKKN